jgi:cysteine desulfurase/selenocysteine lyase
MSLKSYFPLFEQHPKLVYLDSAASTQKPSVVIDGVSEYLKSDYANIHRGSYSLSEQSEFLYRQSKQFLADFIRSEAKEIIYSYNSTYCFNLLAQALIFSKKL